MSKDSDTPKGPDFEKLIRDVNGFIQQNQKIFQDALTFGKDQFAGGQKFVDAFSKYGMDASGRLNKAADAFQGDVDKRITGLDQQGQKFGQMADAGFEAGRKNAEKITGELMPGFQESAQTGTSLIDRYSKQGIPFQDEYINKLKGWDSTQRREDRAAQAVSDINATTEAARESELRRLESYGSDPNQTRSAALDSRIQAQNAIAKAQAANQGRRAVETEGLQLGKTASDMYNESLAAGRGLVESANTQGGNIASIAAKPWEQYMGNLARLGEYGLGVGQLEQAGGRGAFDMRKAAEDFGYKGLTDAASYYDINRKYGSQVFNDASKMQGANAAMATDAHGAATGTYNAQLEAKRQEDESSFLGGLGKLAGMAIPAALGSPWVGTAMGAVTGKWSQGGPVDKELSPSKGAIPDDVPAFLNADEFVLDRDTVRWHGIKNLSKLQKEAREGLGIPA